MDVYLTNVETFNFASEIVQNLSCYINKTAESLGLFNAEFAFTQDIGYADGYFFLTTQRSSFLANLTSMKLNYCQIFSSAQSQYMLKMVLNEIRRIGNFPLECPFKKVSKLAIKCLLTILHFFLFFKNKRYFLKDFSTTANFLPSYIPEMNFSSNVQVNFKDRKGFRLVTYGHVARHH